MGKATKKKSKIKLLEQYEKFIQLYQGEETLVTEQNYSTLCLKRDEFLKKIRNDKADYVLNLKNVHSIKEIELLLNIQRVLFQYDLVIQEMDKQLHPYGEILYKDKDERAMELLEEYNK